MIHWASPQDGRQRLSLDFEVLGRMCENSDHYRPRLWSASWINETEVINDPLGLPIVSPASSDHYSNMRIVLFCAIFKIGRTTCLK